MPPEVQHAQTVLDLVSPQNLERDNQRVLHQVGVDGSVENLDRTVIRGRCKERICSMVGDRTKSLCMVSGNRQDLTKKPLS